MTSIVRIVASLEPSGRTFSLLGLTDQLRRRGFEQELWSLGAVEVQAEVPLRRFVRRSGLDWQLFAALKAELGRRRPDVVHTHGTSADVYGLTAAWAAGIGARVATFHRGQNDQERRWKTRLRNRIVYSLAHRVVAVSRERAGYLDRHYHLGPTRLTCIYNVIEVPGRGQPVEDVKRPRRAGVILCIGQLRREKGQDLLIRSFPSIRARVPGAELWLVGSDPGEFGTELRAEAERLGILSAVRFLGYRNDVAALLELADVAVQPSHADALPRSLVEAALLGRPTVATRVGGIPEVVKDGVTGLLVPPGDYEALAAAVTDVLTDREKAERYGREARQRAEAQFSAEASTEAYVQLYQELLRQRETPRRWNSSAWGPAEDARATQAGIGGADAGGTER